MSTCTSSLALPDPTLKTREQGTSASTTCALCNYCSSPIRLQNSHLLAHVTDVISQPLRSFGPTQRSPTLVGTYALLPLGAHARWLQYLVCVCACVRACVCVFSLFWHFAQSGVQTAVSATSARYGHEI